MPIASQPLAAALFSVATAVTAAESIRMDFRPSFVEERAKADRYKARHPCPRCSEPPRIDGRLDDKAWQTARPLVIDPDRTDRCDVPNGKPLGYITYNRDDQTDIGTNGLVFVDLGLADGVYPGTFATVFRDNPIEGMPRLILGEIGILTVEESYATALVTYATRPLAVGNRVEIK